jgi:hypothetical protein
VLTDREVDALVELIKSLGKADDNRCQHGVGIDGSCLPSPSHAP